MNKTIYIAPEVEQIKVRFEENFLNSLRSGTSATFNNANVYGNDDDQEW